MHAKGAQLSIYIYIYYTPLPLTLANKQQASKQHFSPPILAITPFQRFGLYSTLAILVPRWRTSTKTTTELG